MAFGFQFVSLKEPKNRASKNGNIFGSPFGEIEIDFRFRKAQSFSLLKFFFTFETDLIQSKFPEFPALCPRCYETHRFSPFTFGNILVSCKRCASMELLKILESKIWTSIGFDTQTSGFIKIAALIFPLTY